MTVTIAKTVPIGLEVSNRKPSWAAIGDVNAFFGLMLDNIAALVLAVSLLAGAFQFPAEFALRYMVPGTAIGVLVGDLLFFWMGVHLTKKTGRAITAMPLGLDTPSTFGMVFFVLGPSFIHASTVLKLDPHAAASYTWQIGICSIVISGVFKMVCAIGSGWIRRVLPRAGLLGSLAAIALVLISFLPLVELLHYPAVGLTSLAVILTALIARVKFPGKIPGALAALLVGGTMYYLMLWTDTLGHVPAPELADPSVGLLPYEWLSVFQFEWVSMLEESLRYMPIVIPFALATVVGGIDCTESASAAGDEFPTGKVIAVEALATLAAGLCGGVIQTTPYIGHPAYKAMGGRCGYVLWTALFVGSAGLLGYFGYLYMFIPKAVVFPILVFVGLEITAQSYHATPARHYPAVGIACVPAMAALVMIYIGSVFGDLYAAGITWDNLRPKTHGELLTIRMLANGFIVTSLLWAAALASIIDRRFYRAAIFCFVTALCALFGVIHSPLAHSPLVLPWDPPAEMTEALAQIPYQYAFGYLGMGVLLIVWKLLMKVEPLPDESPTDEPPAIHSPGHSA